MTNSFVIFIFTLTIIIVFFKLCFFPNKGILSTIKSHLIGIENRTPFSNVWPELNNNNEPYGKIAKNLLKKLIKILGEKNIDVVSVYGTLLGVIRHKGFIPWDDDIDVAINKIYFPVLLGLKDELKEQNIGIVKYKMRGVSMIKIFSLTEPLIEGHEWSWPFIDVFGYYKLDNMVCIDDMGKEGFYKFPENYMYPLVSSTIEGIPISIPNNYKGILDTMYGKDWNDICISGDWDHRQEKRVTNVHKVNCKDLLNSNTNKDLFNNCWVINIKKRPDRWKITNERLNKLGIQPHRWEATDSSTPEFKKLYDKIPNEKRSIGEVACYFSHKKLWQHIYDIGIEKALIFEDDAIVSPGITKEDILREVYKSYGFDIIYLGHCYSNIQNFSENIIKVGTAQCLHAYVISRKAIEKILNEPDNFSLPIDKITEQLCEKNLCYVSRNIPNVLNKTYGSGIILQDEELGSNLTNKGLQNTDKIVL